MKFSDLAYNPNVGNAHVNIKISNDVDLFHVTSKTKDNINYYSNDDHSDDTGQTEYGQGSSQ